MKIQQKILVAEKNSFSDNGLRAFSKLLPTDCFDLSQNELIQIAKDYAILVVRLGLQVNSTVLQANPQLKVVATPTTGLDHIDIEFAKQLGIKILSLKGERDFLEQVYATAEHTFALILSLLRYVPSAFEAVKEYQWRRDIYRGFELNRKVLGLIGCGRLGSMVARYAMAFGMRVLIFDPYQIDLPDGVNVVDTLDELLKSCDVLSIHVPLNDETRGMLSEQQFAKLKYSAWLVNTSRGSVIDEKALLKALVSKQLNGAALDVLDDEQFIESGEPNPLIEYARHHDNLIITPHIGGATFESVEKADLFIAEKINNYLRSNSS